MKLYAVRYIEDKAMVGLFYVRRLADIVVQIDAETDPRECECKPISECGAILFGEPEEEGPTTCVGTNACIFAIGSIAPFVIVRLKPKAGHLSVLAKYPR